MLKEYLSTLANAFRLKLGTAEKINAQDFPDKVTEVYNAGYEKGKSEGGDTETAYNEGIKDGKQAEYDKFWDVYQQNGKRNNYNSAFAMGWTDDIYNPKYPLSGIKYMSGMYTNTIVTDTKQEMSFADGAPVNLTFTNVNQLVTIRTIHVTEKITYANSFTKCTNLTNITFEGPISNDISFSDCTKLSKASIENIIGCLADTATGKTLTLSKTAVNNTFGSSESDEWLSLKASKKNWNISLI